MEKALSIVKIRLESNQKSVLVKPTGSKKRHLYLIVSFSAVLKEHWDQRKTLQQNLKDLGLAYNPNDVVKIPKQKKLKRKEVSI